MGEFDLHFRQSEYVGDPSQMRRGHTGTDRRIAER